MLKISPTRSKVLFWFTSMISGIVTSSFKTSWAVTSRPPEPSVAGSADDSKLRYFQIGEHNRCQEPKALFDEATQRWRRNSQELFVFSSRCTQRPHHVLRKSPQRFPCRRWKAGVTAPCRLRKTTSWWKTQRVSRKRTLTLIPVPSFASPSPGSRCSPTTRSPSSIPTRTRNQADSDHVGGIWCRCVQLQGQCR